MADNTDISGKTHSLATYRSISAAQLTALEYLGLSIQTLQALG
jgi:hypothetical protein